MKYAPDYDGISTTRAEYEKLVALLGRFTYKPGYSFEVFRPIPGLVSLRCRYTAKDATNPTEDIYLNTIRPIYVSSMARDERAFMEGMRGICRDIENHETNEWLKLDGVAPFYPHDRDDS
jgi:hypothetical protein